jgi:predicted dehydrogenase
MKVLVLGCGSIGKRHLTVLGVRRDVTIAAFDPVPGTREAVAAINPAINFFADEAAAFAWQPELVIVANPNHCHKDATLKALAAGAHVLCEKPLADTVANGRLMVAAAERAGRQLMVGYTCRYMPAFAFLEEKARRGDFGTLVGGRAMVGTYNTIICSKAAATNPMFGSIIVDYTHELDMLGSIFGPARDVIARCNQLGNKPGIQCRPSLAAMLIEYQNGALVTVSMDYIQHPQRRLFEVFGDRQSALFDLQTNTVSIFDTDRDGQQVHHFPASRNEVFALEHEDAIGAARANRPARVTGVQALAVLEVAERAINQLPH